MADAKRVGGLPLNKMMRAYLKIKEERARLSTDFNEADDKLVSQQNTIKSALLEYLKENDMKSVKTDACLLYTSPSPRDSDSSRMPSSA